MPDVLNALVAFVAEHRRCGVLDGGVNNGYVWLQCPCGGLRSPLRSHDAGRFLDPLVLCVGHPQHRADGMIALRAAREEQCRVPHDDTVG
jgi:hypothetical protein